MLHSSLWSYTSHQSISNRYCVRPWRRGTIRMREVFLGPFLSPYPAVPLLSFPPFLWLVLNRTAGAVVGWDAHGGRKERNSIKVTAWRWYIRKINDHFWVLILVSWCIFYLHCGSSILHFSILWPLETLFFPPSPLLWARSPSTLLRLRMSCFFQTMPESVRRPNGHSFFNRQCYRMVRDWDIMQRDIVIGNINFSRWYCYRKTQNPAPTTFEWLLL